MTKEELEEIKGTINWLLGNGEFEDLETSYNCAMNSINTIDEAINVIQCCTELPTKDKMTFAEWLNFRKIEPLSNKVYRWQGVTYNEYYVKMIYDEYLRN